MIDKDVYRYSHCFFPPHECLVSIMLSLFLVENERREQLSLDKIYRILVAFQHKIEFWSLIFIFNHFNNLQKKRLPN